ncbi:MAG: chitobiase/beta-hexosaminidase C-terminal domain-containing protein [Bacteroidales bacterium]|nr:chitobiase/beta-hexosaminidase C-terminal domain-containing protein [Bacteroidales bacterium]
MATGIWRHTAALNASDSISLGKSASEAGHALEVFAYGIVLEPKTEDARNSLSQVGANSAGFVLDLNKVSTTSFDFSPTISAALAVEGNGSTSGGTATSGGSSTGGNTGGNNGGSTGGDNGGSNQTDTVATPTISGTSPFEETTQVTITGPSEAEIRYTTDGSTPTAESTLYSAALTLSDTTTVKAIAIKNGVSSQVASRTFTKGTGGGDGGEGYGDTN